MSSDCYTNPKLNMDQTVRVVTALDDAGRHFVDRAIACAGIQNDELTTYWIRCAREVGEARVAIHVSRWPEQDCPGYRAPVKN